MNNLAMNALYNALVEKHREVTAAQAAEAELKKAIREELEKEGLTQYDGDGWRATISEVASNRFDTAVFKKEHKKLYEKYLTSSTGTRFTVNAIKG